MGTTFTLNQNSFDLIQCCRCGVNFLIPTLVNQTAWNNKVEGEIQHNGFYCPNGHFLGYKKIPDVVAKVEPAKTIGPNIINFFKKKDHDEHKLDPKPAC